jgi:hypothetical protein
MSHRAAPNGTNPMKRIVLAYFGLVLFAVAPILVTVVSGTAAHAFGCQIDEGSAHPCLFFGFDWGSLFYFLAVSGWLFIVTLPLGAILLLGLTIFLVVRKIRKRSVPS